MNRLAEKVAAHIKEQDLLPCGASLLLAVSGGSDSMVLLDVLYRLAPSFRWQLHVAHLNHQLRGGSSNADERLVRGAAKRLKLPCIVARADIRAAAKRDGSSIEMAARRARHTFLARQALRLGISRVVLAHHLDDQIELFFLRVCRGSGSSALSGMKACSESPIDQTVTLVRPLLHIPKTALLDYAREFGVNFREDRSNADLDFLRNRVRHELLPLLRRNYQPALNNVVSRLMEIVGAESELITQIAEQWLAVQCFAPASHRPRGSWMLSRRGPFEDLPIAVQRRCLHLRLQQLGFLPEFELVENLRRFPGTPVDVGFRAGSEGEAEPTQPSCVSPNVRLRLVRSREHFVTLTAAQNLEFGSGCMELELSKAGRLEWNGVKLSWQPGRKQGQKLPVSRAGVEFFDADQVGEIAWLRHWQPGDRFQPIGMKAGVKLQDLFVNQKVPREARRRLLVATTASGEIFWVEGLRISERFKLTGQTIRRLQWRWQRL
jgi:tRNA(Ile)-lysidine synthase